MISTGIRQLGSSFAATARSGTHTIAPLLRQSSGLTSDTVALSTKSGKATSTEYDRLVKQNKDYSEAINAIFDFAATPEGESFSQGGEVHLRLPSPLLNSSITVGTLAGKNTALDTAHIRVIQKLIIKKSKSESFVRKILIREGYKMGLRIE